MGTRTVMESRLYGGISSAELVAPEGDALERVHTAYSEMATVGRVTDQQRRTFFDVGRQLCRERGAEAIMLGGTDLFLAFVGQEVPSRSSTAPTSMSTRSTGNRRPRPRDHAQHFSRLAAAGSPGISARHCWKQRRGRGGVLAGERVDAGLQQVAGPGLGGALGRRVVLEHLEDRDRPGLALDHHHVDRPDVVGLGVGELLVGELRDQQADVP